MFYKDKSCWRDCLILLFKKSKCLIEKTAGAALYQLFVQVCVADVGDKGKLTERKGKRSR